MASILITTDNLSFEVITHVEYGNMSIKINDPFEKVISEIITPQDMKKLIGGLQLALKENDREED